MSIFTVKIQWFTVSKFWLSYMSCNVFCPVSTTWWNNWKNIFSSSQKANNKSDGKKTTMQSAKQISYNKVSEAIDKSKQWHFGWNINLPLLAVTLVKRLHHISWLSPLTNIQFVLISEKTCRLFRCLHLLRGNLPLGRSKILT